ncbi:MAG: succinylglutamate-semialdehyde dehydrogenase [Sphingobium sp.]|nr:succinylglutamate-semialdehyde dehydrogenase [Sphingobium sp.]
MSATLQSYEPATGALLWEGQVSDVVAEIASVEREWPAWAGLPLVSRIESIRRFANSVRGHEEKFADLIARETGRPIWDAKAEVHALVMQVDLAVGAISERAGQRRLEGAMGARQALRHRPHGIMAVIGSHVQPARIPGEQIIAALLAGNGVLFKPSERTPAVGQSLVDLLHGAGIPDGLLRCILGGPAIGEALALDSGVDGLLFTGTTANGLALARTLAGHPEKLAALNLGSNNPIIAWDTGDIASAAALVVQSAFAATGQNCLAARRLVVMDGIADVLIQELKRLTEQLAIDHPHAKETPFMGPMIDMEAADGVTDSFLYLMSNGGKPILHMKRPFPGLPFVTPGIIDVTDMAQRPDVEYFGPLLQVIRANSFEDAIRAANDTRFGLSAALIGGAPEQYDMFWANSRSGVVNWNRPTTTTPLSGPVGGIGLSGNHRPSGSYAADCCAYPVVSSAIDQPRAMIGVGLKSHAPAPIAPVTPAAEPEASSEPEADAA